MTITVQGRGAGGVRNAPGRRPSLRGRMLRLRNALWARTGLESASPPALVRLRLDENGDGLSQDWWTKIIDEAAPGTALRLEGRNVLACKDTRTILLAAERHRLETTLVTDGPGLEEEAPALYALGLTTLELRLYGGEADHNAALKAPDAFERTVRGALSLKGISCGAPRPLLLVRIPVSPGNVASLVEAIECALAMGADKVEVTHTANPRANGSPVNPDAVISQARTIASRWRTGLVDFFPRLAEREITSFYREGALSVRRGRCLAPWRSVTVDAGGRVHLCCGGPVGDLREQSLSEAFNSRRARLLRAALRKGFRPQCIACIDRFGAGGAA